jgi:hypothetical protein
MRRTSATLAVTSGAGAARGTSDVAPGGADNSVVLDGVVVVAGGVVGAVATGARLRATV